MEQKRMFWATAARICVKLLTYGSAISLLGMMGLTTVDVIGRYFFNSPVFGGMELTELLLAATVFFGLPLVTIREEHVTVDLFDAYMPCVWKRVQKAFVSCVGAICSALIFWRLCIRAEGMVLSGEETAQLGIKLGWFVVLMVITMALTAGAFMMLVAGVWNRTNLNSAEARNSP